MTPIGLAKALVLKLIEETSSHDLEGACKGARPQTKCGNKQTGPRKGMQRLSSSNYLWRQADLTSIGHAKALVLKLREETCRRDLEWACKGEKTN